MRGPRRAPVMLRSDSPPWFPDPREYDHEGLLAVGGDLSPERLLLAYRSGIFPWYEAGIPPLWWSPDPRALLDPASLHVSRSLGRTLRAGDFELSFDGCFPRVMQECGRRRPEGTWVLPEMVLAYGELHRRGHAHSLEVWRQGELVGGIYGVQVGGLFAAESMFHRATDMSKVALVVLVRALFADGIELFDVQFVTPHLRRLGAYEVPRDDYLRRVANAWSRPVSLAGLPLREFL